MEGGRQVAALWQVLRVLRTLEPLAACQAFLVPVATDKIRCMHVCGVCFV